MLEATIIIPAYNESKNISFVLNKLLKWQLVRELIVVDDGSTDNTYEVVTRIYDKYRRKTRKIPESEKTVFKILRQIPNRGKKDALVLGAKRATYENIMFVDADLKSIKKEHVIGTLLPVIYGMADMCLAIRETDKAIFKTVTGERALKKSLFLKLTKRTPNLGRGLELYLNDKLSKRRIYHFYYPGLRQTGKGNGNPIKKLLSIPDYIKEALEFIRAFRHARRNSQDNAVRLPPEAIEVNSEPRK